jgi:hypothetical protein
MATVRKILRPAVLSKKFTLEEARAAWREVKREQEAAKKARVKSKSAAKAG